MDFGIQDKQAKKSKEHGNRTWATEKIFSLLDEYIQHFQHFVDADFVVPPWTQIEGLKADSPDPAYFAFLITMHRLLNASENQDVDIARDRSCPRKPPTDFAGTYTREDWHRALVYLRFSQRISSDAKKGLGAKDKQQKKLAIAVSYLDEFEGNDDEPISSGPQFHSTQEVQALLEDISAAIPDKEDLGPIDDFDDAHHLQELDDFFNRAGEDDAVTGAGSNPRPFLSTLNMKKVMLGVASRLRVRNEAGEATAVDYKYAGDLVSREVAVRGATEGNMDADNVVDDDPTLTVNENEQRRIFWQNHANVSTLTGDTPLYAESCKIVDVDPETKQRRRSRVSKEPPPLKEWQIMGE